MEGEIYNGGFDQFFYNSASDHYEDAIEGLVTLGAAECVPIVQQAKEAVFGDDPVPERVKRFERLEQISSETEQVLDALDRQFAQVAEQINLLEKIEQYAIANQFSYILSNRFHY